MTVKEFQTILSKYPPDTEIVMEDGRGTLVKARPAVLMRVRRLKNDNNWFTECYLGEDKRWFKKYFPEATTFNALVIKPEP